ncbi:hypothetical protein [Desulforhopalus sp. IMCC35007]|uniref:hypothetical protein n=1 Tax=Desulforhopalus sp. IMCC35007 TaxID=2569543 RepID=UPI0010AE05B9|nr:hypothetical protein [Desulforhopalus sp. IMCC35007]TKB09007.1 hypothetical protein FCL48_11055 [Desulforhopalus sp. IMCC35007]
MIDTRKVPIGGIKFSEERVHFSICCPYNEQATINDILQHISKKQVTIPFLCHLSGSSGTKTCFCVSAGDVELISDVAHFSCDKNLSISCQRNVASITIFPHRNNLTLVPLVMCLMDGLQLPVYSFSTSISALVFNTDFHLLELLAHHLTDVFDLPDNHSPFHPEFQLRQPRSSSESEDLTWRP